MNLKHVFSMILAFTSQFMTYEDKRMKDKDNLKKFVIVFEGFDKYYIEEW